MMQPGMQLGMIQNGHFAPDWHAFQKLSVSHLKRRSTGVVARYMHINVKRLQQGELDVS